MPPVTKVGDNEKLIETSKFPHASWPFSQFNPVQSRIFDYYDKDNNLIIATATSSGKAQPDDSLVLTPFGYRKLHELHVGDLVIDKDGKPCCVSGVYPQGVIPTYKVLFKDKTHTLCSLEHLWLVRTRTEKNRGKDYNIKTLKEILAVFKPRLFEVPLNKPVEFNINDSKLGIAPYLTGFLIGDGCIKYGSKFTSSDEFCVNKVKELLPKECRVEYIGTYERKYEYNIIGEKDGYNPITTELRLMGIFGLGSSEKFIPEIYKYASVNDRIELLRGLMDSDGCKIIAGSPTFEVTSEQLAHDVVFLIRSLGGCTRVRKKPFNNYTYKGEKREGKPVYRVTVFLPEICPFHLAHKKVVWEAMIAKRRRHILKTVESIECIGEMSCRCISVDSPSNTYITNDFIVTHNTVIGEMALSYEIRKRGGKGMYLVPLKALAQEKINEWTDEDHHFRDLKISVCTGDYRLTAERKKELEAADLIIMSYEMFNSRVRNMESERSKFLKQVGTLVADEVHLLTVPRRGDHLEAGLMRFSEINKDCRMVFLSATMPNVDEIANWVSFILNSKDTVLLSSKFRPCPLNVHYEKYWDGEYTYDDNEQQKVNMALQIVEYYPDDKFLIFAHTKKTGNLMKQALHSIGVKSEFHNADLDKATRTKLEKLFKTDKDFRVIVATSTLAWGLNLPARRVIILGVHRGLEEVANYDVMQMVGRAGRPLYDPVGDAYILLPERTYDLHKERIKKPQLILSQMLDQEGGHHKVLAFHLVSEIHQETIKTREDVHHWYKRSLAHFQANELDSGMVDGVLDLLKKCGAVWEEDGVLTVTSIGKIASLFYYSPFDVSDLKKNFTQLFDDRKENDDLYTAIALANIDTCRFGIVSKAEREDMGMFANTVALKLGKGNLKESVVKIAYVYHQLLGGISNPVFASMSRTLQFDFPRLNQVLQSIDSFTGKWNKKQWLVELQMRMNYGVKGPMLFLCQLPGIAKVRANKLYKAGIKSLHDVVNNPDVIRKVTGLKKDKIEEILSEAKKLLLTSPL